MIMFLPLAARADAVLRARSMLFFQSFPITGRGRVRGHGARAEQEQVVPPGEKDPDLWARCFR